MLAEQLRQSIIDKIRTKELNVNSLEKKAGLKKNSVRNIILGTSNNPSIGTLDAIASVLGCTIDELIGKKTISDINNDNNKESHELLMDLFCQIVDFIEKLTTEQNLTLSLEELLYFIKESYIFSLNGSKELNPQFIEWLIKNKLNIQST